MRHAEETLPPGTPYQLREEPISLAISGDWLERSMCWYHHPEMEVDPSYGLESRPGIRAWMFKTPEESNVVPITGKPA